MNKTERIKEVLKSSNLNDYYNDYEEFNTAEELIDELRERITEEEVIYYSRAIEYLKENDNSLYESLSIASELGYDISSLSSEILATLLYQRNLNEELDDLTSEIEEVYNQKGLSNVK